MQRQPQPFRLLTLTSNRAAELAADVEAFLNMSAAQWSGRENLLPAHAINPYQHLMTRIDPKQMEAMIEANKESLQAAPARKHSPARHGEKQQHAAQPSPQPSPVRGRGEPARSAVAPPISIDDFCKIDLRIARIVNAEHVEGADKLLR